MTSLMTAVGARAGICGVIWQQACSIEGFILSPSKAYSIQAVLAIYHTLVSSEALPSPEERKAFVIVIF